MSIPKKIRLGNSDNGQDEDGETCDKRWVVYLSYKNFHLLTQKENEY